MAVTEHPISHVEAAVRSRYSGAAKAPEAQLCCPTSYDPRLPEAIPAEVLDLGSGSGKICFIAPSGQWKTGSDTI